MWTPGPLPRQPLHTDLCFCLLVLCVSLGGQISILHQKVVPELRGFGDSKGLAMRHSHRRWLEVAQDPFSCFRE